MEDSKKASALEPLRARVRRFQLVVGMGFLALVAGAVISAPLGMRLQPRVAALDLDWAQVALAGAVSGLWLWAVLPAVCYAAARVFDLRPWSTALGAALTGQGFLVAIALVSSGLDGLARPVPELVLEGVSFAAGVVLSRTAVVRARARAARVEEAARVAAQVSANRYADFSAAQAKVEPPGGSDPKQGQ